jgi:hypothetical protein
MEPAPLEIFPFDNLGNVVSREETVRLCQRPEEHLHLSRLRNPVVAANHIHPDLPASVER